MARVRPPALSQPGCPSLFFGFLDCGSGAWLCHMLVVSWGLSEEHTWGGSDEGGTGVGQTQGSCCEPLLFIVPHLIRRPRWGAGRCPGTPGADGVSTGGNDGEARGWGAGSVLVVGGQWAVVHWAVVHWSTQGGAVPAGHQGPRRESYQNIGRKRRGLCRQLLWGVRGPCLRLGNFWPPPGAQVGVLRAPPEGLCASSCHQQGRGPCVGSTSARKAGLLGQHGLGSLSPRPQFPNCEVYTVSHV